VYETREDDEKFVEAIFMYEDGKLYANNSRILQGIILVNIFRCFFMPSTENMQNRKKIFSQREFKMKKSTGKPSCWR
jgi:hypothetical protein